MTIAVVRYNAGNIHSVSTALSRLGADFVVSDEADVLRSASHVIFPGVGEASSAMRYLHERGLDTVLRSLTSPVLGVCLGLQLLCRHSEENDTDTLAIVETDVIKLTKARKVPHMGWSTVHYRPHPLFSGIPQDAYFYFVHSFAAQVGEHTVATTCHEEQFASVVEARNFLGVQFHPEKSGENGHRLLQNFLSIGAV